MMDNNEILKYALENGMLDISAIQNSIDMKKYEEYLSMHTYDIWVGKTNGKYYTYLPDDKKGRVLVKKNTSEDINNAIVLYWKVKDENPTVKTVFKEWNDRRRDLKKICNSTHTKNENIFIEPHMAKAT